MRSPSPAPRLCLARNDTHFREGWPGEEFSPRPSAARCSVTLGEDESQCRAPDGAGHVPSLNPQKHALAELSIGGHPTDVKSPACACYISNASHQLNSLLRCPPRYGVGTGSCYQQVGSLNLYSQTHRVLASGCWVSSSKNRVSLAAVSQYYYSFMFPFANWPKRKGDVGTNVPTVRYTGYTECP